MKKYTIYKVKEGTIVTLYSTPGGWSMSSRFGMDVTDYTWDGISYIDAIRDILREKKIDEKKFFESLDAKRSYTIGFRHPKRHPFKPSYDIWFVQSCDLENGQVYAKNSDAPTGLSFHEEVVTSSIYELFKNATKSLNDVLTGEANEPNFGYILKGIGCRNLLIESRLLQEISKLYYSKIHMKTAKEYKMDRVKYVVLRSFLTKSINKTFITLFPQFEPEFAELRKVSNKILHHIGCSTESELPRDLDNDKFIAYANQIKANLAQKITKHNPALYSRYAAEYLINPIHIPLYANLYKFKHPVNSHSESGPDKVTISDYLPSTISS